MLYLSNWSIIFTRIFTVKCTFAKKKIGSKDVLGPKKELCVEQFWTEKILCVKDKFVKICVLVYLHTCIVS